MAVRIFGDVFGTLASYFRIGPIATALRLKNSSGVLDIRNAGDSAWASAGMHTAKIFGTNASNSVSLVAPGSLASAYTLTLPPDDGSTGQVLRTDGSGTLTFVDVVSNSDLVAVEAFTEATSSPLTVFTAPANAIITAVRVVVSVAAGGGSPTISVGFSGTPEAYMATAENDLKNTGVYEVAPQISVGGSPLAVIATITPSSQTFTGAIYIHYTNPA